MPTKNTPKSPATAPAAQNAPIKVKQEEVPHLNTVTRPDVAFDLKIEGKVIGRVEANGKWKHTKVDVYLPAVQELLTQLLGGNVSPVGSFSFTISKGPTTAVRLRGVTRETLLGVMQEYMKMSEARSLIVSQFGRKKKTEQSLPDADFALPFLLDESDMPVGMMPLSQ